MPLHKILGAIPGAGVVPSVSPSVPSPSPSVTEKAGHHGFYPVRAKRDEEASALPSYSYEEYQSFMSEVFQSESTAIYDHIQSSIAQTGTVTSQAPSSTASASFSTPTLVASPTASSQASLATGAVPVAVGSSANGLAGGMFVFGTAIGGLATAGAVAAYVIYKKFDVKGFFSTVGDYLRSASSSLSGSDSQPTDPADPFDNGIIRTDSFRQLADNYQNRYQLAATQQDADVELVAADNALDVEPVVVDNVLDVVPTPLASGGLEEFVEVDLNVDGYSEPDYANTPRERTLLRTTHFGRPPSPTEAPPVQTARTGRSPSSDYDDPVPVRKPTLASVFADPRQAHILADAIDTSAGIYDLTVFEKRAMTLPRVGRSEPNHGAEQALKSPKS